jgi:hypothetical protein
MSLGPIVGGAIKLTADEDVTSGLGVGEGIETTLSLRHLPEWQGSPQSRTDPKTIARNLPAKDLPPWAR